MGRISRVPRDTGSVKAIEQPAKAAKVIKAGKADKSADAAKAIADAIDSANNSDGPSNCNSELTAAAYAALANQAGKRGDRDALTAGHTYKVALAVNGSIDGVEFATTIAGGLSVGIDSTRASSTNPPVGHILALALSKMNEATRERFLRELPEEFTANCNELPAVDPQFTAAADCMLKRLRASKTQDVRGSVTFAPHVMI